MVAFGIYQPLTLRPCAKRTKKQNHVLPNKGNFSNKIDMDDNVVIVEDDVKDDVVFVQPKESTVDKTASNEKMRSIPSRQPGKATSPPIDTADLFVVDTKPAARRLNASQIPLYERSANVLDEQTEARKKLNAEAVNKCSRPKARSSCFNCGDTKHLVHECPKPRNNARVLQAVRNRKKGRSHVDAEQRFAHIKPGQISTQTRHALGLAPGEQPSFFYRLRTLGYPPAWLEEAKVQRSGITVFNEDGTEDKKSDDDDGKYDINKIVEFPGFNVQPSGEFFDDFQRHNVPPLQPEHSKANFIKSLGKNVTSGYTHKKLKVIDKAEDPPATPIEATGPAPPQNIKASFQGTPVLKFSVDKLPEGSNFKVGLSDVINFETPNSTGKFKQIKDLLKDAREKMMQSED